MTTTTTEDDRIQTRPPHNYRDQYRRAAYEFPDMLPPKGTQLEIARKYRLWLKRRGLKPDRFDRITFGAVEPKQEASR